MACTTCTNTIFLVGHLPCTNLLGHWSILWLSLLQIWQNFIKSLHSFVKCPLLWQFWQYTPLLYVSNGTFAPFLFYLTCSSSSNSIDSSLSKSWWYLAIFLLLTNIYFSMAITDFATSVKVLRDTPIIAIFILVLNPSLKVSLR